MENNKRPTFQSPYDEFNIHIGKPFTIVGYTPKTYDDGSETFTIIFESFLIIEALPEEIFFGLGWEPSI